MKAMQRSTLILALAGVLAMPTALMAAETATDAQATHHPDQAAATVATVTPQERAKAMRERMREIRTTKDQDKRKALIEAQMKDMEAMMEDGGCPMMADGKGGMGMGPGMGMGMGPGMGPGMGMGPGAGMGMMGQGGGCMGGGMGPGKGMGMGMGMGPGMGMMGAMAGQHEMMEKRMEALEKRLDMLQMMMQMQMNKRGR